MDEDQRLVFGWASVAADRDGKQLVDHQGDMVDVDELEHAAYDHVLHFRSTGERHDQDLRDKGRLVESVVFTQQKLAAMGIGQGVVPYGWWVGYRIDDDSAWQKIKSGEYAMFSIRGLRQLGVANGA